MDHVAFPKIPRLIRECVVTEKLDGSNMCIHIGHKPFTVGETLFLRGEPVEYLGAISEDSAMVKKVVLDGIIEEDEVKLSMLTSRTVDPDQFLIGSRNRWIDVKMDHYNFAKWCQDHKDELLGLGVGTHYGEWWGQGIQKRYKTVGKTFSLFNTSRWGVDRPACCSVVPVLYQGLFNTVEIDTCVSLLRHHGSVACPGSPAEGIIVYHVAANQYFKQTLVKDEEHKNAL